eukprot:TRINITY_DN34029_c0_g1_i1.p1 TRINITY_DN34029_c0_g1~~TRINITY_DN34029_c0_g1_i1.p1  ORF type:complete len:128 (-),score=44.85 TRINITY_DN34029_c0_g1_i1:22-357(-)
MLRSLVGSEMCIRDSVSPVNTSGYSEVLVPVGSPLNCSSAYAASQLGCSTAAQSLHISYNTVEYDGSGAYYNTQVVVHNSMLVARYRNCLLYTSDAADEEDSVVLWGISSN